MNSQKCVRRLIRAHEALVKLELELKCKEDAYMKLLMLFEMKVGSNGELEFQPGGEHALTWVDQQRTEVYENIARQQAVVDRRVERVLPILYEMYDNATYRTKPALVRLAIELYFMHSSLHLTLHDETV